MNSNNVDDSLFADRIRNPKRHTYNFLNEVTFVNHEQGHVLDKSATVQSPVPETALISRMKRDVGVRTTEIKTFSANAATSIGTPINPRTFEEEITITNQDYSTHIGINFTDMEEGVTSILEMEVQPPTTVSSWMSDIVEESGIQKFIDDTRDVEGVNEVALEEKLNNNGKPRAKLKSPLESTAKSTQDITALMFSSAEKLSRAKDIMSNANDVNYNDHILQPSRPETTAANAMGSASSNVKPATLKPRITRRKGAIQQPMRMPTTERPGFGRVRQKKKRLGFYQILQPMSYEK